MWLDAGVEPWRLSSVWILTAPLALRNGPRKHRQAEIDRRGIEYINGRLQIDSQIFFGLERPRLSDQ